MDLHPRNINGVEARWLARYCDEEGKIAGTLDYFFDADMVELGYIIQGTDKVLYSHTAGRKWSPAMLEGYTMRRIQTEEL